MLNHYQREFITKHLPLAKIVVRKRLRTEFSEQVHDAMIDGLIAASRLDNPDQPLIIFCITTAVLDAFRRVKAKKRNGGKRPFSIMPDDAKCYGRVVDDSPTFDELIAHLSNRQQRLLRYRYEDDLSCVQAAERMHEHPRTMQREENRALSMLRYRVSP